MSDDKIDLRLRPYWMEEKLKRWTPPDQSHEAYLAWWRANGGEDVSREYTMAEHAEVRLRIVANPYIPRGTRDLFHLYDRFRAYFGPLVGAEAFRRKLAALATAGAPKE